MAEDFVGIRALKNRGGIGIAVGESTNMETSSKLNELSDSFNRSRNIQRSDIENR